MSKPTIFFSHSSLDRKPLATLKDVFCKRTGGSIDVFLSSDGQSIPFGKNWVHDVQQALDRAKAMFVFVTPNSLRSNWLHFEAGYAYSKGLRVIPVGLFGIDLSAVAPPLSLLQGFNVKSETGLSNIVAIANEVFSHTHSSTFLPEDFRAIAFAHGTRNDTQLGEHAGILDQIVFNFSLLSLSVPDTEDSITKVADLLKAEGHPYRESNGIVDVLGIRFSSETTNLRIEIDPTVADIGLPLVERAARTLCKDGLRGHQLAIEFIHGVGVITRRHKLTGRLSGTEIALATDDYLRFRDVEFSLGHLVSFTRQSMERNNAYVSIRLLSDELPVNTIRDLLHLLFERGVAYIDA